MEHKPVSHGMESIRELYKIGRGPSSSHTMGPEKACKVFMSAHPDADSYKVILYGSLAKTGKGHGTDTVIKKTFSPKSVEVVFNFDEQNLPHPNTMDISEIRDGVESSAVRFLSVGGGKIVSPGETLVSAPTIYELSTFEDIAAFCEKKDIKLWQYAETVEGEGFFEYMREIWQAMCDCIRNGLTDDGILPGGLNVAKKAKLLYRQNKFGESPETHENRLVCSYAFAVGEQNASGENVVTAPTCGASGVLPAVLYYYQKKCGFSDEQVIHALETAGIIGNIIKTNASISGAECGCQAEIGSACSMAAAALGELFELGLDKIEYAAEIAMEHHLGLTCDPICGLVQIPCIERNAVAAMRAINAISLADFLSDTRKISFDRVVLTMKETGLALDKDYKETSEGGLAKLKL